MEIKLKQKYRPTRTWYGYRRNHSGNSNPKRKGLPGLSTKSANQMVMVMDGRTGKARMRRVYEEQ